MHTLSYFRLYKKRRRGKLKKKTLAYQLPGQFSFVSIWQGFLHGQHDTVGNDGEKDGVLERWPLDEEFCGPTNEICLTENEQGGRALLLLVHLLFLPHFGLYSRAS